MMFTLLLLALMVSGVGAWANRRWRIPGQILMVVGIVSLAIISVFQIWHIISPSEPEANDRGEMALSSCLGSCIVNDLAGQRGTVILLLPPRSVVDENTEQSYEDGFVMPMRHGHGGMLQLKALRLEAKPGKDGYDLATFQQALAKAPDALAIVSYAGVPVSFNSLFSAGQPNTPVFYVFDPQATTNWLGPLKDGHVRAVVLPRPGTDTRGRATMTGMPEQIFEKFYLLATPETADQVAAQLVNK